MPRTTFIALVILFTLFSIPGFSQNPLFCTANATPLTVRIEGLAEKMGDIVLNCSGGTPGAVITGNLSISLSVPVTNRLTPGTASDIVVTADTGSGPVPLSFTAQQIAPQTVSLNGLSFTTPTSGSVILRIDNLRGNATNMATGQFVVALLAFNGLSTIAINNNNPIVGVPQRGLLSNASSTTIRCVGSPVPSTISMTNLFTAGTHFESTRLTEGFATAFQARGPLENNGTRFLIKYTSLPAGVTLFVPDMIAGSDALQPTAGGDLGTPQALGKYTPGSNTLLLERVPGADITGNGGIPSSTSFDSAAQLTVSGGTAYVVYEVVDSNPTVQESAQFPTFVGLASTGATPGVAQESISFAPVSVDASANSSAPIPRFIAVLPPSDCALLADCNASYFPALFVPSPGSIQFTAIQGGLPLGLPGYIAVQNVNRNQSVLNWTASVKYQSGADWLVLSPTFGLNNGTVRVDARPQKLAPGTYSAQVLIDAGVAGNKLIPVTLQVNALPPVNPQPAPPVVTPPAVTPPAPSPTVTPGVTSVTNGANFLPGPVVAGSIATIKGTKFTGKSLAVTFDGVSATILYSNDTQINLQVPESLGTKASAQVVVTVDGVSSPAATVPLTALAPAIFANGILNEDSSGNNATRGALAGSVVQIFLTGLATPAGTVLVKIHDREDLVPVYAGTAPGLPGVQQVNVVIPADLPAMMTEALVCGLNAAGSKVCSAPAPLALTVAE
jgi:uncharacterized protein (TIGR03437 family)